MKLEFKQAIQFDWDTGNIVKNLLKHEVSSTECEEVFGDENKVVFADTKHSREERRHIVIGCTKESRLLYVVFTIRRKNVRIISARDLNRKEEHYYEKRTQSPKI